jgi:hypothetical protein
MKIHADIEQNSTEWLILRSGKVTASEVDALVSPTGKIRSGDGVQTYLNKKLCEHWIGGNLPSLSGIFDIEQGKILEERAKPAFTLHTGIEIRNVGFITTDDGRAGCSPDAMIGEIGGVEIKCPRMETHIGYLLDGELPAQYVAQVQMSMLITGFEIWHFFCYNRSLPPLHLVIKRDEKFQAALETALGDFRKAFDAALTKLIKLNGGAPDQRTRGNVKFVPPSENNDLIP